MNIKTIITGLIDHVELARFKRRLTAWVLTKFSAATASVSNTTGTPSVTVTENANGGMNFAFANLKGDPGSSGVSAYFYIRYSDVATPTDNDIYTSPSSTRKYVGFAVSTSPTAPTTASSYTWSKYVGEDGAPGTPASAFIQTLTQAEYDALVQAGTVDPYKLYIITS